MSELERAAYNKVTWRLIPFLFLCYILAFIDRVNVGYAKLQMQDDLHMSETVFGLGMGVFFIGYFFFEVPSNVMLQRLGARRWLGPIMIVWGIISSLTMFVQNTTVFYCVRFVLGIVQSGFFPGVVLYLTFWYTRKHRARMIAAFMSAIAISQTLGGPISGWIMAKMSGIGTLRGWQWLFLIEGIPSVIIGIIALVFLDDGPQTAHWLSAEERELLTARLAEEEAYKKREGSKAHRLIDAFKNSKVWLLCLAYFGLVNGVYGATFWLPQIIKDRITADLWLIGLISMIPWGFGAVAMIWWGRHSDLSEERHWHVTAALGVAALFFVVSGIQDLPAHLAIGALTIAIAGITSSLSTFWAIPTAMLSGTAAAGGIAWINSVGNLGGYVSPHLIGYIRDQTGNNMFPALVALAVACLFSGLIILVIRGRP